MRTSIWLAALLAALALVSDSRAQLFGTSNAPQSTRLSPASQTGFIGPTSYLGSGFRLRNLFPTLRNPFSNSHPIGRTSLPEPGSKDYFKAFGFKVLK